MLFKRANIAWKVGAGSIVATFLLSLLVVDLLKVKESDATIVGLPSPTKILPVSKMFSAPTLKALKIDPENPLNIDFVIDTHDQGEVSKEEASKLIRYFLTGLTVPEDDLWVNLSPYEQNRIINDKLSVTDVGRDMLAQDYVLKQLISSLTYPESDTGKDYWESTYEKIMTVAKTINVPVNTFNKVWIVPDRALVYENDNMAVIKDASLDVMLEEDYMAQANNQSLIKSDQKSSDAEVEEINKVSSNVMKDVVIPEIVDDVNYGKNFSQLRQMYSSLILSKWFKTKFMNSFYGDYINKGKVEGVDNISKLEKEKIYGVYVQAFKKGCYDYIKKEYDPGTKKEIQKRYFSGGISDLTKNVTSSSVSQEVVEQALAESENNQAIIRVNLEEAGKGLNIKRADLAAIDQFTGGLNDLTNDVKASESISKLRRQISRVYKSMGLSVTNYHNDLHNKGVEFMGLVLMNRKKLLNSERDIVVASIGGMLHDFMFRKAQVGDKGTPANVEETIKQLDAMLGFSRYDGPSQQDSLTYAAADFDNKSLTMAKRRLVRTLNTILNSVEGVSAEELYSEVKALIKRTDFNSNVPLSPELKNEVVKDAGISSYYNDIMAARAGIEKQFANASDNTLATLRKELSQIIDNFENVVNESSLSDKDAAIAWAKRQVGIEINYLDALNGISHARRSHINQMAQSLETGDQLSFYVLSEWDAVKEVVEGLGKEVIASVDGSYPFFFKTVYLNSDAQLSSLAEKIKDLRRDDKQRFLNNLENFAKEADKSAQTKPFIPGGNLEHFENEVKPFLESAWDMNKQDGQSAASALTRKVTNVLIAATAFLTIGAASLQAQEPSRIDQMIEESATLIETSLNDESITAAQFQHKKLSRFRFSPFKDNVKEKRSLRGLEIIEKQFNDPAGFAEGEIDKLRFLSGVVARNLPANKMNDLADYMFAINSIRINTAIDSVETILANSEINNMKGYGQVKTVENALEQLKNLSQREGVADQYSNDVETIRKSAIRRLEALGALEVKHKHDKTIVNQETNTDSSSSALSADKDAVGGIDLNDITVDTMEGASGIQLKPMDISDFAGFSFTITKLESFERQDAMLASFL